MIPINLKKGQRVKTTRFLSNVELRSWKYNSECADLCGGLMSGAQLEVAEVSQVPGNVWFRLALPGRFPPSFLKVGGEEFAWNFTPNSDPLSPKAPVDLKTATINDTGLKIIKEQEGDPKSMPLYGPYLKSYVCPAGKLTIGWGHTGADVIAGKTISLIQAENLLKSDLRKFETGVANRVLVPLSSNQFSALVSFSFNVGLANFETSTLLDKLNRKDYSGAADEFSKWTYATVNGVKKSLNGLVKRRDRERTLFATP